MLPTLERLLQNEVDPAFAKRAAFIFTAIEKAKPKRVLDVGCGRGFYIQAISKYPFISEIHGVDLNETYLKKAKKVAKDKRITLKKASIYELPYQADYFDVVICSEILEHLTDDAGALTEVKRVMKKNGTLLVSVPNKNFPFLWDPLNWLLMRVFNTHVNKNIWWLAGMWADHEKLYSKEQLVSTVKKQGFSVEKTEQFVHNCWPFSHFLLYGIGKNLVERLGVKTYDRFAVNEKSRGSLLAKIVGFPSRFDSKKALATSSVDIAAAFRK